MKKIVLLSILALCFVSGYSQAPEKSSYQAVIRDASGNIRANVNVTMQLSVLQGSATGTAVYTENHSVQTNAFGLVNLALGGGTVVSGTFSTIDWAAGPYFIKVKVDGVEYGTTQVLSVPYALYAKKAANGFSGAWADITGKPAGFADGIDNVDDADNSITNEIQTLNLSGTTLSLSSGGGSVTLPSSGGGDNWGTQSVVTDATLAGNGTTATPLKIAQQSATIGQVMKWNGGAWAPANDSFILPYNMAIPEDGPAFYILNSNTNGTGIYGHSHGIYGVQGRSQLSTGAGVFGENRLTTGTTYGVKGEVLSPAGYSGYFTGGRFYIEGNTGIGVADPTAKLEVNGQVKIIGGSPGVGKVLTSDAVGLASWVTPTIAAHNHIGQIWNASVAWSEAGLKVTNTLNGPSIWGLNSGGGNAIRGDGDNNSIAVYGQAYLGAGVKGHSESGNGIEGSTNSPYAYSGYFTGGKFYVEGNTGIGTKNPARLLHVYGTANPRILVESPDQPPELNLQRGSTTHALYVNGNYDLVFYCAGDRMALTHDGKVGIGTSAPNYTLDVRGTIGNNTTLYHSDRRWKTDVQPIKYGINDLLKLNGVSYLWNTNEYPDMGFDNETQLGFIAQEFEKVIPELVRTDEQGYKSIDYVKLTPVLVEAIKEQQQQIAKQQNQIDELTQLVNILIQK